MADKAVMLGGVLLVQPLAHVPVTLCPKEALGAANVL
ncbi:hypothetical protein GGR95_000462 [Sulfitobacter undariae]|uniref:Uncharacterized protein n=1 Tax=Sulfitobacter undariae TaxID=1563671 RepID=A0A7W6E171_9RHOB|nr:hypothetical protein [Sulfitobacter undariae]